MATKAQFASDSSILIQFDGLPSPATSRIILAVFEDLQKLKASWPIEDLHPAYCSLLIDFNPAQCPPEELLKEIETLLKNPKKNSSHNSSRFHDIEVVYGADSGEDLEEVAKATHLSVEEVIYLHSTTEYTVSFLGFSPGFPYLLGLPKKLFSPRKAVPRTRVPAGSVAIAGMQTGIYPVESPGGWQLIGQTEQSLFDPYRDPPTLLRPGDRVKFRPIEKEKDSARLKRTKKPLPEEKFILKIEDPGFCSTLQDRGRPGLTHLGISPGGAADEIALRIGNRLVGNKEGAAAIEMTAEGVTVTFLRDTWFSVTGGDCSPELDQQKITMWSSLPASAGQRLVIHRIKNSFRSYLCVHGGFEAELAMGSRSTFLSGHWGGWEGRCLVADDRLPQAQDSLQPPTFRKCSDDFRSWLHPEDRMIRICRGPQWHWFSKEEQESFLASEFVVTEDLNRSGIRLQGPAISYETAFKGKELISEGISNGSIQIPASGQPMILFCEQRTTGGYPKIANVIRADWHRLGQMHPGETIRFQLIEIEEAWQSLRSLEAVLKDSVYEF